VIPPGFIQDLLARTDVVEVVGRHVELKRGGANWMGLCPFHGEKSPSFSVSPSKQFYYCFGCGAGGDAIRFLTEHLGVSFIEAVRELAQHAGISVPEEQVSPEETQRRERLRERRSSLTEVMERAQAHYRAQLREHQQAVDYLKHRGLSGRIAAHYGLGFAPPGWRGLASVFPRYDDPLLQEAGLVRLRDAPAGDAAASHGSHASHGSGGLQTPADPAAESQPEPAAPSEHGRYDWFRNRVMFPIRAVSGEVIGFGGRVLDDSKPKYINSPETPLFSKGRELYGLYEARSALRERGHALVVEGYMDVVALAQCGFGNAVATLGTACTAEHVAKLFRFTDAVVFAFDGDAAGRRAAARALEASLPHLNDLRSVRFLFLPPEHDPDSYVRALGAEAFERAVTQAVPLSRQLLEQASEGCDLETAEGRARMLAQARGLWAALPPGALAGQVLAELAQRARLDSQELARLWESTPRDRSPAWAAPGTAPPADPAMRSTPRMASRAPVRGPRTPAWRAGSRPPAASADLAVRLLLRRSDWWDRIAGDDRELLLGLGDEHGAALAWLERQLTENGDQPLSTLAQAMCDEPFAPAAADWIAGPAADDECEFEDLQRVLHRLWRSRLEAEVAALIAEGRTDRERLDEVKRLLMRIEVHRAGERLPATPGNAAGAV
jgi:DNA primase